MSASAVARQALTFISRFDTTTSHAIRCAICRRVIALSPRLPAVDRPPALPQDKHYERSRILNDDLKACIRDIPDFPKPGILFRDITPLLANGVALRQTVDRIAAKFAGRIDMVLGIESRGFIVGSPVAYKLNTGLAVVRKPGKLPSLKF